MEREVGKKASQRIRDGYDLLLVDMMYSSSARQVQGDEACRFV